MTQRLYLIQHYEPEENRYVQETLDHCNSQGYHKIGISKSPNKRLSILSQGTPFKLRLLTTVELEGDAKLIEQRYHDLLIHSHKRGEWYGLLPNEVQHFIGIDSISETEAERLRRTDEGADSRIVIGARNEGEEVRSRL